MHILQWKRSCRILTLQCRSSAPHGPGAGDHNHERITGYALGFLNLTHVRGVYISELCTTDVNVVKRTWLLPTRSSNRNRGATVCANLTHVCIGRTDTRGHIITNLTGDGKTADGERHRPRRRARWPRLVEEAAPTMSPKWQAPSHLANLKGSGVSSTWPSNTTITARLSLRRPVPTNADVIGIDWSRASR
jgi:hypothetical protein